MAAAAALSRSPLRRFLSDLLGRVRRGPRHAWSHARRAGKRVRSTAAGQQVLWLLQVALHPIEFQKRHGRRTGSVSSALSIDLTRGGRPVDWLARPGGGKLVTLCREIHEASPQHRAHPKDHLLTDLLDETLLGEHQQFVDCASQDDVIGAVTRYLGTIPVLRRVGLLLSTAHTDRQDSMCYTGTLRTAHR